MLHKTFMGMCVFVCDLAVYRIVPHLTAIVYLLLSKLMSGFHEFDIFVLHLKINTSVMKTEHFQKFGTV
jgi:hypothetical protein